MTRLRPLLMALTAMLLACATHPEPEPAARPLVTDPTPTPTSDDTESGSVATRSQDDVPVKAVDPCAEFNRHQQTIDASEHQRRFGCPPCPCACVNGEIRCAPCVACNPNDTVPRPLSDPTAK